jgi:hypothetical protein
MRHWLLLHAQSICLVSDWGHCIVAAAATADTVALLCCWLLQAWQQAVCLLLLLVANCWQVALASASAAGGAAAHVCELCPELLCHIIAMVVPASNVSNNVSSHHHLKVCSVWVAHTV